MPTVAVATGTGPGGSVGAADTVPGADSSAEPAGPGPGARRRTVTIPTVTSTRPKQSPTDNTPTSIFRRLRLFFDLLTAMPTPSCHFDRAHPPIVYRRRPALSPGPGFSRLLYNIGAEPVNVCTRFPRKVPDFLRYTALLRLPVGFLFVKTSRFRAGSWPRTSGP